jgi:hypothetical protein
VLAVTSIPTPSIYQPATLLRIRSSGEEPPHNGSGREPPHAAAGSEPRTLAYAGREYGSP